MKIARKPTHWTAGTALTPAILVLAACGGAGSEPEVAEERTAGTDTATGPAEPAEVVYQTSFGTFGRDAYAYVAEEQGYFSDAGLEVTIEPGSGSVDVMKLVASGQSQFGVADFSALAITRANEQLPVKAVAAIQQRSLAAIMALAGSGVSDPADLEGRTVGDTPGSTVGVMFPAYANAAGIDADRVEFVPGNPQALPQLLAEEQVDAIGQFVVGESLVEEVAQGREVTVLPYGDVLPDLYGIVLLTSDSLAESDPELVRRFSEALLRGLEYTIDNPAEAAEILQSHEPTTDVAVATAEIEAMAPYVAPDRSRLGDIDEDRVARVIEMMGPAVGAAATPGDLIATDLVPAEEPG